MGFGVDTQVNPFSRGGGANSSANPFHPNPQSLIHSSSGRDSEQTKKLFNISKTNPQSDITAENIQNRILTWDVDETLVGRLKKSELANARKLGYQVYKVGLDKNGKEDEYPYFVVRPHMAEVLKDLRQRGYIHVESSRNFPYHIHTTLSAANLEKYFLHEFSRLDISTKENQNKKLFPHHSNNISLWDRTKDWLYRKSFGRLEDSGRWIRSKLDSREKYFQTSPAGTVNKYTPHLDGGHFLIDDKLENTKHAKRSTDWYHFAIKPMNGSLESLKFNAEIDSKTGRPKWALPLYEKLDYMEKHGWGALITREYGIKVKDPERTVPVKKEFADKLEAVTGVRLPTLKDDDEAEGKEMSLAA